MAFVKRYGVPYQGSKNSIAKAIVDFLPAGEVLVDLFAGGCAITHAALLSGKWKRIICNDLGKTPDLFVDAINGRCSHRTEWVSHEEFMRKCHEDPFIASVWSFGNSCDSYIYSSKIEPYKKAYHEVCYAETPYLRHIAMRHLLQELYNIGLLNVYYTDHKKVVNIEPYIEARRKELLEVINAKKMMSLGSLKGFNVSQNIEHFKEMERDNIGDTLTVTHLDYRAVDIPQGAVVYCDPPYQTPTSKGDYGVHFDYDTFRSWAKEDHNGAQVFISEYNMPDDDFVSVWETSKRNIINNRLARERYSTEHLYVPRRVVKSGRSFDVPQGTSEVEYRAPYIADGTQLTLW